MSVKGMAVLCVFGALTLASACSSTGNGPSLLDTDGDQQVEDGRTDAAQDSTGDLDPQDELDPDSLSDVDLTSDQDSDLDSELHEDVSTDQDSADEIDGTLPDLHVCTPGEQEECYEGPAGTAGVGVCKSGLLTCSADGLSWSSCEGQILPMVETCVTPEDEDCDGTSNVVGGVGCVCQPGDEQSCYSGPPATLGIGLCVAGTRLCNAQGTDFGPCDGEVLPLPDACGDGVDSDCTGLADDGAGKGGADCVCIPEQIAPCYTGSGSTLNQGVCHEGTAVCATDGTAFGPCVDEQTPTPDSCLDELDNDCDGVVNNGYPDGECVCQPGAVIACYTGPIGTLGVGLCVAGLATCDSLGRGFGPCEGEYTPQGDVCGDGLDGDCNGVLDDGAATGAPGCVCLPGEVIACYTGLLGTLGVGECLAGTALCQADGTGYGACEGETLPSPDHCLDLKDNDCNGVINDGYPDPSCICIPGATMSCYPGPDGTLDVGDCKAGSRTCNYSGNAWGSCMGAVVPVAEICGSVDRDRNCDGIMGNIYDTDGDGWTICQGDCCETVDQCPVPKEVNPGALDFAGDGIDDNCDGTADNGVASCDAGLVSNSSNAVDYAKSMELCDATTENPPLVQKKWGLISASLLLTNGAGVPSASGRSIRPGFGNNNLPQKGSRLVVLSTGAAADPNDTNPSFSAFEQGLNQGTTSAVPADFLAANGNMLPVAASCPQPAAPGAAYDPVMLKLRVRVPTNARSFSFSASFFSADYPEFVCSQFNDFFVALLSSVYSGVDPSPADKNLAFDKATGLPLSSGAMAFSQLYRTCTSDTLGCNAGAPAMTSFCPSGSLGLSGTGFDLAGTGCGSSNAVGGGTGWITVSGNVVPGEIIELRLAIWDVGDAAWDSLVLLDSFRWNKNNTTAGITM